MTKLNEDTMDKLIETLNDVSDFTSFTKMIMRISQIIKKVEIKKDINKNILSVGSIDGFSMLFNLKKFDDKKFFDENFFLYLENDDLCMRVKNKKESIYIITNAFINHKGSISNNTKLEYLRNWHWMWSKFYFNKKHYGFFNAIYKTFLNFISACIKYLFYSILFNTHKKKFIK